MEPWVVGDNWWTCTQAIPLQDIPGDTLNLNIDLGLLRVCRPLKGKFKCDSMIYKLSSIYFWYDTLCESAFPKKQKFQVHVDCLNHQITMWFQFFLLISDIWIHSFLFICWQLRHFTQQLVCPSGLGWPFWRFVWWGAILCHGAGPCECFRSKVTTIFNSFRCIYWIRLNYSF